MLLDPLSLERTVMSGLKSIWEDSPGEEAGCTFHCHSIKLCVHSRASCSVLNINLHRYFLCLYFDVKTMFKFLDAAHEVFSGNIT